jgi:hypothetical protein
MLGARFCQRHFLNESLNSDAGTAVDCDGANGYSGWLQGALLFVGRGAVETCFAPGPIS